MNPMLLGPSSDRRTNRWRVKCISCEKDFEPPTTMRAKQLIDCQKCGCEMIADYNAEPPTVALFLPKPEITQ